MSESGTRRPSGSFSWSSEEALGSPLLPVPRQERSRITELHADGKSHAGRDVLPHRRDGSIIEVRIWTAPLHDPQGAFLSVGGYNRLAQ